MEEQIASTLDFESETTNLIFVVVISEIVIEVFIPHLWVLPSFPPIIFRVFCPL